MPTWNKLHSATNESLVVADLIDKEPDAAILWFMMIAGAGAWGRFPAEPRKLARRVCGLSERLTGSVVAAQTKALAARGLIVVYADHNGAGCIAISHYFEHNDKHAWHRLGPPEFGHPPNWIVPQSLIEYLEKVAADKFKGKELAAECDKFMISPTDYSVGVGLGTTPKEAPTVQRTENREQQLENNNKEEGPLQEGTPSTSGEPNSKQPASDSLNLKSNDYDETIQTAFAILSEFAEDNEGTLLADLENGYTAYPEHVVDAAMSAAAKCREGKGRKWNASIAAYFRGALSNMAAAAKEANDAEPMRGPFTKMFGLEPDIQPAKIDWQDDLRNFTHWPQKFLKHQQWIREKDNDKAGWVKLKAKAIELGVWWDGVRPYLEAARQAKDFIERSPGALQDYEVREIAEIDEQIAALEKEFALEQG